MGAATNEHVVIIGGGPAGLTAALELVRAGAVGPRRRVTVLECDDVVGGIARTVVHREFRFDIGGHRFFTKNDRVRDLWHEILGPRLLRVPRLSRIFYDGRFFDYPLRPLDAAMKLGPAQTLAVAASYARSRLAPRRPELSFEDWVVNRFGCRLFDIFFKTYTEKVWGIPTDRISADWAAQRIRGLSLRRAVADSLRPRGRGDGIKTLIREFEYPELGPGQMWETVADLARDAGVDVALQRRVTRIRHENGRIVSVAATDGTGQVHTVEGTAFLSSMPLKDLVEALEPGPPAEAAEAARALRYRDFVLVALVIEQAEVFPDNWIYIHSPDVAVGRIQNFKNWSPHMVPDPAYTCLGMEYFCDANAAGDATWTMSDGDLVQRATRELERLGLPGSGTVVDGKVVRMHKTYPTYDLGYDGHVDRIRAYLGQFANLQVIGRNGMHKYNNQDHSMMTGILAARNLLGDRHDLWAVNTDAEYLEMKPLDQRPAD